MKNSNPTHFASHTSLKKIITFIIYISLILFAAAVSFAQNVNIPDANFKAALVANNSINTNEDGEISDAEAEAYSGGINADNQGITDLTGIESFPNIISLSAKDNSLTSVDLTQNTQLTTIRLDNNSLTSLDVSSNTLLTHLQVFGNALTSIDVSANADLEKLWVKDNALTQLNTSSNAKLTDIECGENMITSLDLSNNPELTTIQTHENNLTSLDVSNNPELFRITAFYNNLSSIDLSNNPLLTSVNFEFNQLTSIDVSMLPILTSFKIRGNGESLVSANLQNGNNSNFTGSVLLDMNPNLTCIQVDDPAYSEANWTDIDDGVTFSTDCDQRLVDAGQEIFDCVDINTIRSAPLSGSILVGTNDGPVDFTIGSVLLYQTNEGRLGKILVKDFNESNNLSMILDWETYAEDGSIFSSGEMEAIFRTDLDAGLTSTNLTDNSLIDFTWSRNTTFRSSLLPGNGVLFHVYDGNVNIPDSNFKAALIENSSIDTNEDDEIQLCEAKAFDGTLSLTNLGIEDLTGIEAFTSMTELLVGSNTISSLDISSNAALEKLTANQAGIQALNFGMNPNLTNVIIWGNELTDIDVSGLPGLLSLSISSNDLPELDVTNNPELFNLDFSQNPITQIDLSQSPEMAYLYANTTDLTSLDVSNNPNLFELWIISNELSSIDVTNNPLLESIIAGGNDFTSIDVSQNPALKRFQLNDNALTSLDLSNNSELTDVRVANNNLTSLNLANGANSSIINLEATGNTDLVCIQVDDPDYSEANWTSVDEIAEFKINCDPNAFIDFPDANFKAALAAHDPVIDINVDGEISYAEAEAFAGAMDVANQSITDMTGIEFFTEITTLSFGANDVVALDLSKNLQLTAISGGSLYELTSLDLGENEVIRSIGLARTKLTELDLSPYPTITSVSLNYNSQLLSLSVDGLTSLDRLTAQFGILPALDVSTNSSLTWLELTGNDITALDITALPDLIFLEIDHNPVGQMDLTANTKLTTLGIGGCGRTSLDVSHMSALKYLYADGNDLTSMDLSNNPALQIVRLNGNMLESLDLRNGNNTRITDFNLLDNPELACILVDDIDFANANWTDRDSGANFSDTYCELSDPVYIPDTNFKAALVEDNSINTNEDSEISYAEAEAFTGLLEVENQSIEDLSGIEAFINLTQLNVANNQLSTIDVSANTKLTILAIQNNSITSIDISSNEELLGLRAENNELSSIIFNSSNTDLQQLAINNNHLMALDVSILPALSVLLLQDNDLSSLTLGDFTVNEQIEPNLGFDIRNNPNLRCISITNIDYANQNLNNKDENMFYLVSCEGFVDIPDSNFKAALLADTEINTSEDGEITFAEAITFTGIIDATDQQISDLTGIEAFENLTQLRVGNNSLTSLDLTNNTKLTSLIAFNNEVSSVDITGLKELEEINLTVSSLSEIDLSEATNLKMLILRNGGNNLTEIDLSNNPMIERMNFQGSNITSLDVAAMADLMDLRLSQNSLTALDLSQNLKLETLYLGASPMATLDLANNPMLKDLRTSALAIDQLDLSNNTALEIALINNFAELSILNLANGANELISRLQLINVPNLSCTTVDDVSTAEDNFTDIDDQISFSTDCSNGATEIIAFSLPEQTEAATIDNINHTILLEVVTGTAVTNLTPTIVISDGASISPMGPQDFTNDVNYTVTAENFEIQDWIVSISVPENEAPAVSSAMVNIEETEGFGSVEVSLASVFSDPDGDALTYSVVSSDETVATAVIDGDQLTITEVGTGQSTLTVTAADGNGGSVSTEFLVTVNEIALGLADEISLKVYPNPVIDQLKVDSDQEVVVQLMTLEGRILEARKGRRIQLDVSAYSRGVYLLRITHENKAFTERIMKNN